MLQKKKERGIERMLIGIPIIAKIKFLLPMAECMHHIVKIVSALIVAVFVKRNSSTNICLK